MRAWRACVAVAGVFVVGCYLSRLSADDSGGLTISSPDFLPGQPMPSETAKAGGNRSPRLSIGGVPAGAKSLALIVDDPDAPAGLWTHWLVWNIAPDTKVLAQGKVPRGAVEGTNSFGNVRYDGPAPPSGTHRYFFHVYALDTKLALGSGASRGELDAAMQGHVLMSKEVYGTYSANP